MKRILTNRRDVHKTEGMYTKQSQLITIANTVNTQSTAIRFQRISWINEFGGLTGYSLVLVHYIGTGNVAD